MLLQQRYALISWLGKKTTRVLVLLQSPVKHVMEDAKHCIPIIHGVIITYTVRSGKCFRI